MGRSALPIYRLAVICGSVCRAMCQSQSARPLPTASDTFAKPSVPAGHPTPLRCRPPWITHHTPMPYKVARPTRPPEFFHRLARPLKHRPHRSVECQDRKAATAGPKRAWIFQTGVHQTAALFPRSLDVNPSRDRVVLVAMIPLIPVSRATSAISAISSGVKSGQFSGKSE